MAVELEGVVAVELKLNPPPTLKEKVEGVKGVVAWESMGGAATGFAEEVVEEAGALKENVLAPGVDIFLSFSSRMEILLFREMNSI